MTVHMISVGLSILDSLHDPRRSLRGKPDLARVISREEPAGILGDLDAPGSNDNASKWLVGALAVTGDSVPAAEFAATAQAVQPGQWPRDISAEAETFARVPGARCPLAGKDIAVLVCSDTAAGLLAGAWNAAVLTGGDLDRISYLADPATPPGPLRGRVLIVRVPGLDAADERGFRAAMRGLGALGHHLLHSADVSDGEGFRFYLSGGFKAAIPYLIGLAEGLRSLPEAGDVEAFVLHETSRDSPPVRLPLRYMLPERVQKELMNLSEEPSRQPPPSDFLDGYAYEQGSAGWRLTAYGVGLKALFGIPPPGLVR